MFTGQQMPYNTPHMPVLMLEIILLLNCLERIVVMTFFFIHQGNSIETCYNLYLQYRYDRLLSFFQPFSVI